MHIENTARPRRLKALIEADPGALVRVLQFFQIRNVVPCRVNARRLGSEYLEVEINVDPVDLEPETFRLIAAKIEELPIALVVARE